MKAAIITTALSLASAVEAAPVQWTGAGSNGHYYDFITGNISWNAAANASAASSFMGTAGNLVTITSAAEQAFIEALNPGNVQIWIGASDASSEGSWEWVTGEAFSYSNWAPGQPNNFLFGQDYAMAFWNGTTQWNDCGFLFCAAGGYIIEYAVAPVPLPASLSLAALGLAALGYFGRRRKPATTA